MEPQSQHDVNPWTTTFTWQNQLFQSFIFLGFTTNADCTFFNYQWKTTHTWQDHLLYFHFSIAPFLDHQDTVHTKWNPNPILMKAQIKPAEHDVKPTEVAAANAYDLLLSMLQHLKDKDHNLLDMVQELQQ